MKSRILTTALLASALITPALLAANAPKPGPKAPDAAEFFAKQVKPILQNNCVSCHSGDKPQGNLRLTSRAAILKGGDSGPALSTKDPDASLILDAINYKGRQMPPQGKLGSVAIQVLTRWVKMGAPWPGGEQASIEPPMGHSGPPKVTPETMKFWSFQQVKPVAAPAVKNKAWVKNPIDAFILNKLEANGLQPNPPATRQALIRRAYYDMLGLPPSPEEVQAFISDKSPDAWQKVVDRLLASPHYGEKWGRHWLDLVRFAESNSYERDGEKPYAWRYRDYVIQSLNEDKPYDQFIKEQLAGDELPKRTPEGIIATGYYRLGIWDDEPADPEQATYDDLDDIASTTSQVFLGLTIGCARCHDHKLDPIPQKDYYKFLSFFAGVTRFGERSGESIEAASIRPIDSVIDPQVKKKLNAEYEARVDASKARLAGFEKRILEKLTPLEKQEWQNPFRRAVIMRAHIPADFSDDDLKTYANLNRELRSLEREGPAGSEKALCVTELQKPREMHVLMRGNPHVPGDPVEPGYLAVLAPPQPQISTPSGGETCGRRLALANWIADPKNPLTARVMANRVWQFHFGRGIVRSTSNFGFQGDKPTHPELLDWLAGELVKNGWKLKPLHREILLSNAYQMSAQPNTAALKKDPENDFFWRFDMRRLEAEELRDSILAVDGTLNLKMGGHSIYPTIPAEVLAGQSMPGAGWGHSTPEEQCRRSVYIFVKRSLAVPMIASFDGPETDFSCAARFATTQPTQALGMMNSAFVQEQAQVFAGYLKQKAPAKSADQVTLALRRVLQREPTAIEVKRGVRLIERLQSEEKLTPDQALSNFCLVALNLNEFIYLN